MPRVGAVVVSGGWDGAVYAWRRDEIASRTAPGVGWDLLRSFEGAHGAWVASVAASSSRVVAGDTNGRVTLWGYDKSRPARLWRHGGSVTKVCFVPCRRETQKTNAKTPSDKRGKKSSSKVSPLPRRPYSPASHPSPPPVDRRDDDGGDGDVGDDDEDDDDSLDDSRIVASASTDADVKLWDASTGAPIAVLRGHVDVTWHVRPVFPPNRRSDDAFISLLTASRDASLRLWRVPVPPKAPAKRRGRTMEEATCVGVMRAHADAILAMDVYDGGRGRRGGARDASNQPDVSAPALCATAGADAVIIVWDVEKAAAIAILSAHEGGVLSATFWSRGGGRRASSSSSSSTSPETLPRLVTGAADGCVRLWEISHGGACLAVLNDHSAPVTDVRAFGAVVVTVAPGDGVVAYYHDDADDGKHAAGNGRDGGLTVAFALLDGAGNEPSACVHADGETLAVGAKTGAIAVLDFRPWGGS